MTMTTFSRMSFGWVCDAGHELVTYQGTSCPVCDLVVERDEARRHAGRQCHWRPTDDESDAWETTCGRTFQFITDGPNENNFRHCPYCGGALFVRPDDLDTWFTQHRPAHALPPQGDV